MKAVVIVFVFFFPFIFVYLLSWCLIFSAYDKIMGRLGNDKTFHAWSFIHAYHIISWRVIPVGSLIFNFGFLCRNCYYNLAVLQHSDYLQKTNEINLGRCFFYGCQDGHSCRPTDGDCPEHGRPTGRDKSLESDACWDWIMGMILWLSILEGMLLTI